MWFGLRKLKPAARLVRQKSAELEISQESLFVFLVAFREILAARFSAPVPPENFHSCYYTFRPIEPLQSRSIFWIVSFFG